MERKINILCVVLGILTWSTTAMLIHDELKDIRMTIMGLILTYVFSLLFILFRYTSFIKTDMFSDIKEDYKSPVYKLERTIYRDWCIRKYNVSYSTIDSGWMSLFTPIFIFKFKQYVEDEYLHLSKTNYDSILGGHMSPQEYYEEYLKKIEEEELKETRITSKIREINKEYYNNFKK